jgi:ribosomal protein S18 acetylase RimI-like enzyme
MSAVRIRRFAREDIPAVRDICVATGRMKPSTAPAPWIFARYWTDYYTRFEPSHSLVAVGADNRVVGYLTACYDTRVFRRKMKRSVLPSLLMRSVLSGAMAHPASRNFIVKRVSAWAAPDPDPEGLLEKFPAHLHVNILKEAQGKGVGQALMERFLKEAREAGVKGVHLETLASNLPACRFFIRAGFREFARLYPFKKLDPAQAGRAVIVYARKI